MWKTFGEVIGVSLAVVVAGVVIAIIFGKISITCVDFFTKFCAVVIR